MAVIQVEDDGIGIPAEEQEHIFERFHQANSHKDNTGSGIGLNVAKEYVQLHNGKIEVSSVPGKGSCFTVRIPVGKISHVPPSFSPKFRNRRIRWTIPLCPSVPSSFLQYYW